MAKQTTTANTSAPCTVCGANPCMALIRADIPPLGLVDLVDRTLARLVSGHWTIRDSLHLIALVTMIAFVVTLATLAITDRLIPLGVHAAYGSWEWAYLTGGGLFISGGYAVRRICRQRRAQT